MGEFWLGLFSGVISSVRVVIIVGALRAPRLDLDIAQNIVNGDYGHGQFRLSTSVSATVNYGCGGGS